jgi:hypothetical protein
LRFDGHPLRESARHAHRGWRRYRKAQARQESGR